MALCDYFGYANNLRYINSIVNSLFSLKQAFHNRLAELKVSIQSHRVMSVGGKEPSLHCTECIYSQCYSKLGPLLECHCMFKSLFYVVNKSLTF